MFLKQPFRSSISGHEDIECSELLGCRSPHDITHICTTQESQGSSPPGRGDAQIMVWPVTGGWWGVTIRTLSLKRIRVLVFRQLIRAVT